MDNISDTSIQEHFTKQRKFDRSTFIGILAAFGLVIFAISLGGQVDSFFSVKSLLIVVGGTLGAALVSFPLGDFLKTGAIVKKAFFPDTASQQLRIKRLINIARSSRNLGVMALQEESIYESDPFLKIGLELSADGIPAEEVQQMLEIDLGSLAARHYRGIQLFQTMGIIAPAMGLIGTLIGLIQMLTQLDNPSGIGPSMALALTTTFYGAILANLVFLPIAGKLQARSEEELFLKALTIEGVIAIIKGINPRLIEQRLLAFLAPDERKSQFA